MTRKARRSERGWRSTRRRRLHRHAGGTNKSSGAGTKEIWLVRHGQGVHNATHNYNIPDPHLTNLGEKQAIDLRGSPELQSCQLVVVSPLRRAIQTAVQIYPWLTDKTKVASRGCRVYLTELHSERHSGPCDSGSTKNELTKEFPFVKEWQGWKSLKQHWTPTEQTDADWQTTRVPRFMKWVSRQRESKIVVVGHGTFFEACGVKKLRNCEFEKLPPPATQPNALKSGAEKKTTSRWSAPPPKFWASKAESRVGDRKFTASQYEALTRPYWKRNGKKREWIDYSDSDYEHDSGFRYDPKTRSLSYTAQDGDNFRVTGVETTAG
jgi:broad specificity phosphatase PhoE